MYTTAQCPYCTRAEQLLRQRGVSAIEKIRIDADHTRLEEMLARSGGRRTVPQIFIEGRHIGGCDDLIALDRQGGLVPLLGSGGTVA
jgi:glutaredoxin 3